MFRQRAYSLLLLVLIAVVIRNLFFSDKATESNQPDLGGQVETKSVETYEKANVSIKPIDPELALKLYKTVQKEPFDSRFDLSELEGRLHNWFSKTADNVNSLMYNSRDFDIEILETNISSAQIEFYSVHASNQDLFVVRDKSNESIMFIGKLTGKERWDSD